MSPITNDAFNQFITFVEKFLPISTASKLAMRPMLMEAAYLKGSRILNFKQTQTWVWFLLEGLVREIRVNDQTFEEHTNWLWQPNNFIYADPGFFSQEPSERTFEILQDSRVVGLSYINWSLLKGQHVLVEPLTERIRSSYSRIRQHHADELLTHSTDDRYLGHQKELDALFMGAKVKYIAEYMGMTADTLGRLRKKYRR